MFSTKYLLPPALLLVLLGCGGSHAPTSPKEAASKPAVQASTTAVEMLEWDDALEAPGSVRARTFTTLTSRAMGYVTAVHPQTGDRVAANQIVVELEARELQTAIQAAKAQLDEARQAIPEAENAIAGARAQVELAETTLRRMKELLDKRSVSQQEYDEAAARAQVARSGEAMARARRQQLNDKIRQAEEAVRVAEVMASYTTIRAPFAGRVTARRVEPGALAAPGTPLLDLERDGAWRFEAAIEESRLRQVRPGMTATVTLDAIDQPLTGRVSEIVPSVDEASRTFLAKIDLPPHRDLRSGLFGRARFTTGVKRPVMAVPETAVLTQGQLQLVFVADSGVARSRLVRLGAARDGQIEVLSGVRAGERVIHPLPPGLVDGARLEVRP
jgi:RND family efflux transporter MFP subunit